MFECLVEFLRIDTDLLAVAAEQSAEQHLALPTGIEEWIRDLPETEKNEILLSLIKDQDPQLGARLLQRYRTSAGTATDPTPAKRRTVGGLLEAAARRRQDREQAEVRRQAEMRANYLEDLARREDAVWRHVEELVAMKQAKAYTEAVSLLQDLQELNLRKDRVSQFKQRCDDLCIRHQRKKAFIDRMKQAGLQ